MNPHPAPSPSNEGQPASQKTLLAEPLPSGHATPNTASLDPSRTDALEAKTLLDAGGVGWDGPTDATGKPGFVPGQQTNDPTISGYRITEEIARGGMGRIFAGQDLTLDREVAIKTLLPGANGERFITEAKITARLPHPNIPPVYALGMLADGAPWLAMKLIRGRTLADLLQHRPSSAADRPRLIQIFEQIAQAVGFAHSRGIIHRDLKPLNVMVGEFGEVQVMDWGLAKDLTSLDGPVWESPSNDDNADLTAAGAILGTPGFMAPEQARGELVDARSDVFALGSILAAILTGKPAFVGTTARETIAKAAHADLADVRERLARSGADAELITLALRCLAAAVAERPADGREVAAEVAAYRAGVEVRLKQAETERAEAVVREVEQRKRRTVWFALATVLLAGVIASSLLAVWAVAAERTATAERDQKEGERAKATAAAEKERLAKEEAEMRRQEAERNLGFARKGNEILGSVFTGLDPKTTYETVAELRDALKGNLTKAIAELDGTAIGDPLEVAKMQNTLGQSLLAMGEADLAIQVFDKVRTTREARLGPDHPDTLTSMGSLAAGYYAAGKLDQALPLYEETLRLMKAKLGPDHPSTLTSMSDLAAGYRLAGKFDQALPLQEETLRLQRAKLGPDHPATLASMNNLAAGYQASGKLDQALPLQEETLRLQKAKLGPDHPATLASMNNLARGYEAAGKLEQARLLYEESLPLMKAKLGSDHPITLITMKNLAGCYEATGKLAQALPLQEETLRLQKAKLGPDHPETLSSMNNLAKCYRYAGKLDLALPLYEETLRLMKAKLGPDHPDTFTSMNNLAAIYSEAGKLDLALPLQEETLRLRKAKLGPDHPDILQSMNNLAVGYQDAGQLDRALPLYEETFRLKKAKLGLDHPSTLLSMGNLAQCYEAAGRLGSALPMLEETLRLQLAKLGPDHLHTLHSMRNLGKAYCAANQGEKAATLFRQLLAGQRKRFPSDDPRFAGLLAQVSLDLLKSDQYASAEELLRECLAIREKTQPDEWTTFNTMSMLGAALLGQRNYAEAEAHLVKGYEGIKERLVSPGSDPKLLTAQQQRLSEALDRLIELYTALEKPDEVKKWQAERAKVPATAEK